ncbi:MAG: peptidyl-alpha-hydroxyglycine alpha-amidating lyase family protein [Chloroflexota bacterium]
MIVGEGKFRYEVHAEWEQLPKGWRHGDVAGVATDSQDRVYVFNRSEHPVIVYERDGKFLGSWGEGLFPRPHGITIVNDIVYLADDTDHSVRKCTLDGRLLMTLGTVGKPADTGYVASAPDNLTTITRGGGPFNRPTRLSIGNNGDLYVSDGYGNARVHRFTADGTLINSWGEPGDRHGEFSLPHSVWAHTDGRVFVCDRENDRVQIFDAAGKYLSEWTNVQRPGDLYIDADNAVYVGQMHWTKGMTRLNGRTWTETRHPSMTVRDLDGNVLSQWGGPDPCAPGSFASPHGLWVDRHGDIYVGEVTQTALTSLGKYHESCHSIQKFVRV